MVFNTREFNDHSIVDDKDKFSLKVSRMKYQKPPTQVILK